MVTEPCMVKFLSFGSIVDPYDAAAGVNVIRETPCTALVVRIPVRHFGFQDMRTCL